MDDWIASFWLQHGAMVKDFFNSSFISNVGGAAVGALCGAYFGASAAQRIAERNKTREELIREIRETNAAISVAAIICNMQIGLKKQYVKSLKETLDNKHAEFEKLQAQKGGQRVFEIVFDFETLDSPVVPADVLQRIVYERLSATGRIFGAVAALNQAVSALNDSMQRRNRLIEEFKQGGLITEQVVPLYFGLPTSNGVRDQRYRSTVDAIYLQTNDCIFFSKILCDDLQEHGERLVVQLKKLSKDVSPKVSTLNFEAAEGFIPSRDEYKDWLRGFTKLGDDSGGPKGGPSGA